MRCFIKQYTLTFPTFQPKFFIRAIHDIQFDLKASLWFLFDYMQYKITISVVPKLMSIEQVRAEQIEDKTKHEKIEFQ